MATGHEQALELLTKTTASNSQLHRSPDIHLWELLHKASYSSYIYFYNNEITMLSTAPDLPNTSVSPIFEH